MRILKGLLVAATLVFLLGGVTAVPCDACEGDGCDGKCEGKCDDGCKCKGKCTGKCDDGCKCKGECDCGKSDSFRYTDPIFFGFDVKRLANGLPVVTWVDEEQFGEIFGFRKGDILLSANGKEIRDFKAFLKALDTTGKVPLSVRLLRSGEVNLLSKGPCDGDCGDDCKCKGKCEGKCGDDCKCKGKCEGKCGDNCKCDGKCDGDCGDDCKCGRHGKKKVVKGPRGLRIPELLGIIPALCDNGTLMVKDLLDGETGSKMGIKKGDVILSINGVDVTARNRLNAVIVSKEKGNGLAFLILRGKTPLRLCAGKCGKDHCDGCKGRCKGGCGSGCGGCGGHR